LPTQERSQILIHHGDEIMQARKVAWRSDLQERARLVQQSAMDALQIKLHDMGRIPMAEEVQLAWGQPCFPMSRHNEVLSDDIGSIIGLQSLRRKLVPLLVNGLYEALFDTGRHANTSFGIQSLHTGDIIVDERYGLYEYFPKTELVQILLLHRQSALELLSTGRRG
jgi:hypothetical protein